MRINDNKKRGDELSAVDWNRVAKISNALINSSWNGLDATINENLISVSLPQGTFITDVRPALITEAGTDNSGAGTYKAVEAQLDTFTDPLNWAWIERLDAHNVWNTEGRNNGDANTEKKYYYDLYEINGTTGIAVGTVVLAMKIGRTANDKGNTDQWVFAIGGAGGVYEGPFAVTYDADNTQYVIGASRTPNNADKIIAGLAEHYYTIPDTIAASAGFIQYEVTVTSADAFSTVISIVSSKQTGQVTDKIRFIVAQVDGSGGIIQNQFGDVTDWGRVG